MAFEVKDQTKQMQVSQSGASRATCPWPKHFAPSETMHKGNKLYVLLLENACIDSLPLTLKTIGTSFLASIESGASPSYI